MVFSYRVEEQLRLTLDIAELKSTLIAFFNTYNEILKSRHGKSDTPYVAADNLLNIIFREQFASNEREKRFAQKLISDVLDLPATLSLPSLGDRNAYLQDLASEYLDSDTRAWLREILDQLADLPERIRKEVRGRYVHKYAIQVAENFECRLREIRNELNF